MITLDNLKLVLHKHFSGVLKAGSHSYAEGEACALELLSACRGGCFTDSPSVVRTWDLRHLNDIKVDDTVRTEHVLPILASYAGSRDWPMERQLHVLERLVIGTVQQLISELPELPESPAQRCRKSKSLQDAKHAASLALLYLREIYAACDAQEDEERKDVVSSATIAASMAVDAAAAAAAAAARSVAAAEIAAAAARSVAAADMAAAAAAADMAAAAAAARSVAAAKSTEGEELEMAKRNRKNVFVRACKVWMDAASDNLM